MIRRLAQFRPSWKAVALTLSVALNLFFLGGFGYARWVHGHMGPPPERRFDRVIERLDLDPRQQRAFGDMRREMRQNQERLQAERQPLLDRIWTQMAVAEPDRAEIARLTEASLEARRGFQTATTETMLRFLAALDPPRRERFLALMREQDDGMAQRMRRSVLP